MAGVGRHYSQRPSSVADEKLKCFKELSERLVKWKNYFYRLSEVFGVAVSFESLQEVIEKLSQKSKNEVLNLVFVGMTSSGKSMLINALLGDKVLLSSVGHCTPRAVAIQVTEESNHYFIGNHREARQKLDINDRESKKAFHKTIDKLEEGEYNEAVYLFLQKRTLSKCSILLKNVAIIDNPGMEQEEFKTVGARCHLEQADALVLIIDMITGTHKNETIKLLKESDFLMQPNVIIVQNKADALDDEDEIDEDRANNLLRANIDEVGNLLVQCNQRYKSVDEAKEAMFFVSAKEELAAKMKSEIVKPTQARSVKSFGYEERDGKYTTSELIRSQGFAGLEAKLLSMAQESREMTKTQNLLSTISDRLKEIQNILEDLIQELQSKSFALRKKYSPSNDSTKNDAEKASRYFFVLRLHDSDNMTGSDVPGLIKTYLKYCVQANGDSLRQWKDDMHSGQSSVMMDYISEQFSRNVKPTLIKGIETEAAEFQNIQKPQPVQLQHDDFDDGWAEQKIELEATFQKELHEVERSNRRKRKSNQDEKKEEGGKLRQEKESKISMICDAIKKQESKMSALRSRLPKTDQTDSSVVANASGQGISKFGEFVAKVANSSAWKVVGRVAGVAGIAVSAIGTIYHASILSKKEKEERERKEELVACSEELNSLERKKQSIEEEYGSKERQLQKEWDSRDQQLEDDEHDHALALKARHQQTKYDLDINNLRNEKNRERTKLKQLETHKMDMEKWRRQCELFFEHLYMIWIQDVRSQIEENFKKDVRYFTDAENELKLILKDVKTFASELEHLTK